MQNKKKLHYLILYFKILYCYSFIWGLSRSMTRVKQKRGMPKSGPAQFARARQIFFMKLNYSCISRVFFVSSEYCIQKKKLVKSKFTKFFVSALVNMSDFGTCLFKKPLFVQPLVHTFCVCTIFPFLEHRDIVMLLW